MEQGAIDPEGLRAILRSRRGRAWVSAVSGPPVNGVVTMLHALVVVGPRPNSWQERTWVYSQCIFSSFEMPTARLAAVLDPERDECLQVGLNRIQLDLMDGNVNWNRKPSLALYDELVLPWPSVAYTVSLVNQGGISAPSGYLVGDGNAPSFPTFGSAYNAFYHDNFAISGTNNPLLGQVSIRFVDGRARIGRVRIRPASLDVWVGGRSLVGTRLELNGAEYRTSIKLEKGGLVSFPLPLGLPSDAWLWLKQDTDWHDFRALSWEADRLPNVETEQLPRDPLAELSLLASQGEGPHLEYKEKLPDSRDEKRNVFKTVVAFANGDGGTIVFGIGDGGELRGVIDKLPEGRRRLNDLLRDLVDPSPSARIEAHRLDEKTLLVLEVLSGGGVLHALTLDRNRPEYYVRRDGTTFYARPHEIASIVNRSSTTAIPGPSRYQL